MANLYLKSIILTIFLLFISGCTSKNPIIDSTFGISSEFDIRSSYINSSQIKLLSVNGLSPITNVGEIYFLHPSRGAQSALMIDLTNGDLGKESFRIQKVKYKNVVSVNDLIKIKSKLLELEVLANKILEEKVSLYFNQDLLEKAKEEDKAEYKSKISSLDSSLKKLNDEYKEKSNTLIAEMKTHDIFIFRWTTNDENKANVNAIGLAEADYKKKEAKSGYVLASGVSLEKLVPTLDYLSTFERVMNNSSYSSWYRGRVGVVTYALKAKNLVSFVSKENERMAKLNASLKNIQQFSKELKKLAQIDLDISSLNTSLLSSSSQYSAPKITTEKISLVDLLVNEQDGGTIFTVITQGFNIRKNFLK